MCNSSTATFASGLISSMSSNKRLRTPRPRASTSLLRMLESVVPIQSSGTVSEMISSHHSPEFQNGTVTTNILPACVLLR